MRQRTNIQLNRLAAIAYLALLIGLALAGVRFASSNYFVRDAINSASIEKAGTAVRVQPENPSAHDALGILLMRENRFADASQAFSRAATLRPNDYQLWLQLAHAEFLGGDDTSAETAYLRAIELAPNYSRPRMDLGRMYLELERPGDAFGFLGAAARLDQSYYSEVLKLANAAFGDNPDAIERAVAPSSAKGKTIVGWYFLDRGWMTEKTRAFLLSDELSIEEKNTVIRFLKEKRDYVLAREVWLSRLASDGETADVATPIFDGGFESSNANDAAGFGWQIDKEMPFSSAMFDPKDVHSGSAALSIRFSGNVEPRRPIVSQIAFIDPGMRYTLSFFVRASNLVSGSLPIVIVIDPATNSILGTSDPIEDSKGTWTRKSISFVAGRSKAVIISFQRSDCPSQPCPIFGEVAVDDFSITPN